jgi:glycosyltransferase involved in cell wall biosynthesis
MNRAPSLLFVSPIVPAETGNGLAMRAGVFLEALARDHAVTLLVVPVAGNARPGADSGFVAAHARRTIQLSLEDSLDPLWQLTGRIIDPESRANALAAYPRPAMCRYATTPCLDAARTALAQERFDVIHVMRSYLAPYAAPFLPDSRDAGTPWTSLDLDDDEADTHRRFAALLERAGRPLDARAEVAEAGKYERHEAMWLPRFHMLITCTDGHARKLNSVQQGGHAVVVANTLPLPRLTMRWPHLGKHILFVGNLSYLPNVEGIMQFVTDTLPRLRARLSDKVTVRIAGSAPRPEVATLAERPDVELVADPPDLAKHYRWADLAVIPVTAGGGTRIKLLEAFAHGTPVVASRIGAEGIAVVDRVHLRLADTAESFAEACAEVLCDKSLARQMSIFARKLVETDYARPVGIRSIQQAFRRTISA